MLDKMRDIGMDSSASAGAQAEAVRLLEMDREGDASGLFAAMVNDLAYFAGLMEMQEDILHLSRLRGAGLPQEVREFAAAVPGLAMPVLDKWAEFISQCWGTGDADAPQRE